MTARAVGRLYRRKKNGVWYVDIWYYDAERRKRHKRIHGINSFAEYWYPLEAIKAEKQLRGDIPLMQIVIDNVGDRFIQHDEPKSDAKSSDG